MTSPAQPSNQTADILPEGSHAPVLLQTLQGLFAPLEYLEASRKRYGDTFVIRSVGFPPTVALSHPKAIQALFSAAPNLFDSARENWILQPLLGQHSLMLLDGEPHQRQRQLLLPAFHGERMRAYGGTIGNITQTMMRRWRIGEPFHFYAISHEISLQVILHAVFGLDRGEQFDRLKQLSIELLDFFNSPWTSSFLFFQFLQKDLGIWSPWGKFIHQKRQLDELLIAEIQQRRHHPVIGATDVLSLMMLAQDEAGQPMTDAELRDELMTLLFAGHETTASAIAWGMYWIHSTPSVYEKLMSELASLNQGLEPDAITKLPYLNAVCLETLRIYPVVILGLARVLKAPFEIVNYSFAAGTVLAPCIYLTHHRDELYPESKCFKPERFLERKFSPYEYFPFGGGSRRCLGYAFALFEMKVVLAIVLSQARLALAERHPVRPVRRGLILTPASGVKMVLKSWLN
jgi:cytochrome P450